VAAMKAGNWEQEIACQTFSTPDFSQRRVLEAANRGDFVVFEGLEKKF
jgi:hypothetical protein